MLFFGHGLNLMPGSSGRLVHCTLCRSVASGPTCLWEMHTAMSLHTAAGWVAVLMCAAAVNVLDVRGRHSAAVRL